VPATSARAGDALYPRWRQRVKKPQATFHAQNQLTRAARRLSLNYMQQRALFILRAAALAALCAGLAGGCPTAPPSPPAATSPAPSPDGVSSPSDKGGAGTGEGGANRATVLATDDMLTLPGADVRLEASLRTGILVTGVEGKRVQFLLDGKLLGEATTNKSGDAVLAWKVPAKAGDYVVRVQLRAEDQPPEPVPSAELLVAARAADAPMIAVDLDKTVVASGFARVLLGMAEPMTDASKVLSRAAESCTIIYLTQRPDFLGPASKKWLADNDFPRGPMLTTTLATLAVGSRSFKSYRLAEIHKTFTRVAIGIGDKASDAQAYDENGLKPLLMLHVNWSDNDPEYFEKLERQLAEVPESTQVVVEWSEVSKIIFDGADFPKKAMEERLRAAAAKLRAEGKR